MTHSLNTQVARQSRNDGEVVVQDDELYFVPSGFHYVKATKGRKYYDKSEPKQQQQHRWHIFNQSGEEDEAERTDTAEDVGHVFSCRCDFVRRCLCGATDSRHVFL